jgi:hypothetical protein
MSEPDPDPTHSEFLRVAQAIRFALVAIILGISYPNIRCALAIPALQRIFTDMLGNKPLPFDTTFAIHFHVLLVLLSFAIPLLAIISLFLLRLSTSIYLAGVLIIAVSLQLFSTWHAVTSPLTSIITGMEQSSPSPNDR